MSYIRSVGPPDLPNLDREIRSLRLTDAEKRQVKAFLQSLTGQLAEGLR
jgi:hypothetical protein